MTAVSPAPRRIHLLADPQALARRAAADLVRIVAADLEGGGPDRIFRMALAGGRTPLRLYDELAGAAGRELPWDRIALFWGDERCVPPDHPDSNYGKARERLLDRVPVPPENVHRIRGELPPGAAARTYEDELRRSFDITNPPSPPAFDLILLGLGRDGHTASLFPGGAALRERVRWVTASRAPEGSPVPVRVTLTIPVLRAARRVWFLVSGSEKKPAAASALRPDRRDAPGPRPPLSPAALVEPAGELAWYLDMAAAGGIRSEIPAP